MDQVAGQVEGEPAIAEHTGLEAGGIGDCDHQAPARDQKPGRVTQGGSRPAKVLQ